MRNVIADLAVEAEAATIIAMRMAGATDAATRGDEREIMLRRIGLAASKYWVCKRATPHAGEAMECLGGNGYAEDSGAPRLYREAPVRWAWEGSGNVSARWTPCAPWQPVRNALRCSSTTGRHRGSGRATGRPCRRSAGQPRRRDDHRIPRPQGGRGHQPGAAGIALGPTRPPGGRRGVPGHPDGPQLGWRVRHPAGRIGPRADHRAGAGQGMNQPTAAHPSAEQTQTRTPLTANVCANSWRHWTSHRCAYSSETVSRTRRTPR